MKKRKEEYRKEIDKRNDKQSLLENMNKRKEMHRKEIDNGNDSKEIDNKWVGNKVQKKYKLSE